MYYQPSVNISSWADIEPLADNASDVKNAML